MADQFAPDPFSVTPAKLEGGSFNNLSSGGGNPFQDAMAFAREQRIAASAQLADLGKAADDQKKVLDLATQAEQKSFQNSISQQVDQIGAFVNKRGPMPDFLAQRLSQAEQANGVPFTEVQKADFIQKQVSQFKEGLANNKDMAYPTMKLALLDGTLKDNLKLAQQQQPGLFRNLAGQAGSLLGGVISSVGDIATGVATLLGADRSNAVIQAGQGINALGEKVSNALATNDQKTFSDKFSKALDAGNIQDMINAYMAAPAFISAHLIGGIIGPAGVVGGVTKAASKVETLTKFGVALERFAAAGGPQAILAGAAKNVPVALGFGASEAGGGANDAVQELLKRDPNATKEQINQAARVGASYAGGITAAGTLVFPGLEKSAGKVFNAVTGGIDKGLVQAAEKKSLGATVRGIAGEAGSQAIEEGLVQGAGNVGADVVQGKGVHPVDNFNPAAAVLGAAMGGVGKTVGNVADAVGNRQAVAQQQAIDNTQTQQQQAAQDQQQQDAAAATQQQTQQVGSIV